MMTSKGRIHDRLLAVLRLHPEGISISAIRAELELSGEEQQHLDRRLRDLDRVFDIRRLRRGREILYVLLGERPDQLEERDVDKTVRFEILQRDGGRCQICGRSAPEGVILHVDHKIPRDWGGSNEEENLWTLCSTCNEGKRNFFANVTDERVRQAMRHKSVHVRIGELLKAFAGEPVPKAYIQMVASTHDDYAKRMRELRELGWRYHPLRRKEGGRVRTYFVLDSWEPWPADPADSIRRAERARLALERGRSDGGGRVTE